MPLYAVHHICTLTDAQKDDLAVAITRIHSTKFTTPKLFVNVTFTDTSKALAYVGGKRSKANNILAMVRDGPSRTQKDWNELCSEVIAEWDRIVPMPKVKRSATDEDFELRSCILVGGIIGGYEAGFMIPPAGGDVAWLKENWDAFNEKAKGDEDFKDMVEEVKERGLMDGKSAKERLEEALGWGDSA